MAEKYLSTTKLISHFNGEDAATAYTDPVAGAYTFEGAAQLDTAEKKFGTASLLLNGTTDYVSLPDSTSWSFGANNFTIHLWVKYNSLPTDGTGVPLISQYSSDTVNWSLLLKVVGSTYYYCFTAVFGSIRTIIQREVGTEYSPSGFTHIALTRSGDDYRLFENGVMLGSPRTYSSGLIPSSGLVCAGFGGDGLGGNAYLDGWVDEVCIINGTALWTSDFTPPTSECIGPELNETVALDTTTNKDTTREYSDAVTISTTFGKMWFQTLSETITASSTLDKGSTKTVSEILQVLATLIYIGHYEMEFLETCSMDDTMSTMASYIRIFTETLALSYTYQSDYVRQLPFSETISMRDSMQVWLRKADVTNIWSDIYAVGGWGELGWGDFPWGNPTAPGDAWTRVADPVNTWT